MCLCVCLHAYVLCMDVVSNINHSMHIFPPSLESIGFFQVRIDTLSFDSFKMLLETIVPTAVFVAVMALQLKYFKPYDSSDVDHRDRFRRQAEHSSLNFAQMAERSSVTEGSKAQETKATTSTQDVTDSTGASPKEAIKKRNMQETIELYWTRFKKAFYLINECFWRLLEIYLPKTIIFVIFAVLLDEISATHFLVLAIFIVAIPLNINPVMYLILTGVISNLSLLKMLYQVALVDQDSFNFTDSCPVRNHNAAHLVKQ